MSSEQIDDRVREHVEGVIQGSPPPAVPYAAIRAMAGRRRRRTAVVGGCAVALLVGGAGIGIWASYSGENQRPAPAATGVSEFAIPTYQPIGLVKTIRVQGTLQFSPDGCPSLGRPGEPGALPLMFPAGFVGRIQADGTRAIVDEQGEVWATSGEHVSFAMDGDSAGISDPLRCGAAEPGNASPFPVAPH